MTPEAWEAARVKGMQQWIDAIKAISAGLKDTAFASSIELFDIVFAVLVLVWAFKLGGDFGKDVSTS